MAILRLSKLSTVQLDRNSLRQQVASILRDLIVNGHIAPGTKITERDVAEMLNISRMPARDALLDLERQGLIISKPGGRFVIELSEVEVSNLYQVRTALEKLAIEEAVRKVGEKDKVALKRQLNEMKLAVENNDNRAFIGSDIEFHKLIWRITGNHYLIEMLNSMTGPIFMFIATQTRFQENWQETLDLHTRLVTAICNQDHQTALVSIEEHMQKSLELALKIFKTG